MAKNEKCIDPDDLLGNKRFLRELLNYRNGLRVHSIHLVEGSVLDRSPKEQLESVGLGNLEPVYFTIKGLSYSRNETLKSASVSTRGSTINSIIDGQPEQIVLICRDLPKEASLDNRTTEECAAMTRLIALAHELGHVEDMRLGENSNFVYEPTPTVDLVEAEAYAHSYCLNHLNSIGANTARNTMAKTLYQMNISKERFEKALYYSVCKKVGKGRIKKWGNA